MMAIKFGRLLDPGLINRDIATYFKLNSIINLLK